MELRDLIKNVRVFEGLADEEIEVFAQKAKVESFPPRSVIIEEGTEGKALYIVGEGRVKITKLDGEIERELARLGKGESFGEMSMIDNSPTSASVVAYSEVECVVISRAFFLDILDRNVEIAAKVHRNFNKILTSRLRSTSAQLAETKKELGY